MIEYIKNNLIDIIIVVFVIVELIVNAIVLWETFTNKSLIDVIWRKFDERQQGSESEV